jgi:hypothetical protein
VIDDSKKLSRIESLLNVVERLMDLCGAKKDEDENFLTTRDASLRQISKTNIPHLQKDNQKTVVNEHSIKFDALSGLGTGSDIGTNGQLSGIKKQTEKKNQQE